jgi:WD40 repeat protein
MAGKESGASTEPRLLRTLRPPIRSATDGKVDAVALSPDAKLVVAGGWANTEGDEWVYIFEASTGRLLRRLGRLANVILHLTFSPDGRRLVATLGAGQGVRVWERAEPGAEWPEVLKDTDYGDRGSYGAVFDAKGNLYTVAHDAFLRRYGPGLKLVGKVPTQDGKQPFTVAVDPSGERLAVGFTDTTAVAVYDAKTLSRLFTADTTDVDNGDLSKVRWSPDGRQLYAGGRFDANGLSPIRIWDDRGRGKARDVLVGAKSTIRELLPCGEGMAFGTQDPALGLLDEKGERLLWQGSVVADMRGKRFEHFTVSQDGKRVRFGLEEQSGTPVIFDLAARQLTEAPDRPADLFEPETKSLNVTDWINNLHPNYDGKPIGLDQYERSRSLAIAPDKGRFVLGTEWSLRAYTSDGKPTLDKAVPSVVWGVNIARNGKLLLAAYGDGTVRWHRLDDGEELLALFVHAKDQRWIAWTPKGYYMASPGAEDLIGFHINRGWDEAADFFPASRFRDQFNRPDIVQRVLDTLDEGKAIEAANTESQRKGPAANITTSLPPIINIVSPTDGTAIDTGTLTVSYTLRSPSGLPVQRVRALLNGRPAKTEAKGFVQTGKGEQGFVLYVDLPSEDVVLSLIAETENAVSEAKSVTLRWAGRQDAAIPKPNLYALLVGVSDYEDSSIRDLTWAAKDARDLGARLQAEKGQLYNDVQVKVLADKEATRDRIVDELDWLEHAASRGDRVILFLSGHGATDELQRYYYLPHDAKIDPNERLFVPKRSTAVLHDDIRRSLSSARGHVLFLFDTCHAGRASGSQVAMKGGTDFVPFINELGAAENGVVVFASSEGRELSQEDDAWKNGAFTKALLEGLTKLGEANPADHVIMVQELANYVDARVKELTGNRQHPVSEILKPTRNLPLATAR